MTKKVRIWTAAACLVLLAILVPLLLFLFESGTVDAVVERNGFRCWTTDASGRFIDSYWSEEKGAWYLFVPSDQDLSATTVQFSGVVEGVSCGEVQENTITGAFSRSGDFTDITCADGTVHTVILMQSDLPSLYIDLAGTDLAAIHADKAQKLMGASVYLTGPGGSYVQAEGAVEISGRGNSSWRFYDKKGYWLKFAEDVNVLGMGAAKKWVLLANASDDSMLRNKLSYHLAETLDIDFVPQTEYVDLWINGEYRGTYLISEKPEIGPERVPLQSSAGVLVEYDEGRHSDTGRWFCEEEEYWFYYDMLGRHFAVKETMSDSRIVIEGAMKTFRDTLDRLMTYLYETPSRLVTIEGLSDIIDVDSFAKYYLVNEYILNREGYVSSFFWYQDGPGDVIHLGPVWDFDTCMGSDGPGYTEFYGEKHELFRTLLAAPVFRQRTEELYLQNQAHFEALSSHAAMLQRQLAPSAAMNEVRWAELLGAKNIKGGENFAKSFEEAVDNLQAWLNGRAESFRIPQCLVLNGKVDAAAGTLTVDICAGREYEGIDLAVWSEANGQDDVQWYQMTPDVSWEFWTCVVPLENHTGKGLYQMHAYGRGHSDSAAIGFTYVK